MKLPVVLATVVLAIAGVAITSTPARAEIHQVTVVYKQGGKQFEGYLAYDDAMRGKRPGVVIVHQWMGLGDYEKQRAVMLAKLGYVAFAADIYGKGVRPTSRDQAAKQAGKYKRDRKLLRARVLRAVKELRRNRHVDRARIAAIGYCFGGTAVLELARSGADVRGVVSFHGGLDSPTPADGKRIQAKVLVLHGAADPHQKPADVAAFEKELADAKVDWQMVSYGNAVHCFTERDAGTDASTGCAYDAHADARSWTAMRAFFDEIFR